MRHVFCVQRAVYLDGDRGMDVINVNVNIVTSSGVSILTSLKCLSLN